MTEKRLRIALQKKGRLAEGSLRLLERAGLKVNQGNGQSLLQRIENFPIDILRVRDDDIAAFVADGVCDLGFVGLNVLDEGGYREAGNDIELIARLGFAACTLQIAVPESDEYTGPEWLSGKRIATSHPRILRRFLAGRDIAASIVEMSGAIEVAPRLQIACAICDLVSTGATIEANGLKAVETVFQSEAVVVRSTKSISPELAALRERLVGRIESVVATKGTKYIMLNAERDAVPEIAKLLPGAGAPTVMPLSGKDAVAVHAVCKESVFWETLEDLKAAGASAILVLPIEKMML